MRKSAHEIPWNYLVLKSLYNLPRDGESYLKQLGGEKFYSFRTELESYVYSPVPYIALYQHLASSETRVSRVFSYFYVDFECRCTFRGIVVRPSKVQREAIAIAEQAREINFSFLWKIYGYFFFPKSSRKQEEVENSAYSTEVQVIKR